ncbi:MAG TPA: hypothetical protein VM144_00770 [Aestuariivirga sp.]|nr:hypothetical protein [Aestuariivirga sp.]
MATVRLRDGEVTLYTREDSKNWYANFRLARGGRLQESLKTRNKAIAKERALERHDDLKARAKYGLTQNTVTFANAADAWLLYLKKQVAGGARKPRTVIDYAPAVERYLKPYFAAKTVDEIKPADILKYQIWRGEYWITGPGANIRTISYVRNGVVVERPVNETYRRYPAPRTVHGENVILRCILKYAVTQGWMVATQIPKVDQAKQTRRDSRERAYPAFDIAEYFKLKRFMALWVTDNSISEAERWRRQAVQDFILILLNSGLREHELFKKDERTGRWRGLRWCDVTRFTSDGNVETVQLHVDGKTGKRQVVCQRPVRVILDRRKLRCPDHKETDFVMAFPDGSLQSGFDSGVRRLLKAAGLLIDPQTGRNRGIYSARHSYATWRLQAGTGAALVARNMGTSIEMIDSNYYHHHLGSRPSRSSSKSIDGLRCMALKGLT